MSNGRAGMGSKENVQWSTFNMQCGSSLKASNIIAQGESLGRLNAGNETAPACSAVQERSDSTAGRDNAD
jgi:hypothetical protein